jgi:hypothetical protein
MSHQVGGTEHVLSYTRARFGGPWRVPIDGAAADECWEMKGAEEKEVGERVERESGSEGVEVEWGDTMQRVSMEGVQMNHIYSNPTQPANQRINNENQRIFSSYSTALTRVAPEYATRHVTLA